MAVLAILIVITAYSHEGVYHAFVMDEIFNISYNTFQSCFYHINTFLASPLWVHKNTSLKTQFSQWKYFSSILTMESSMQPQCDEYSVSLNILTILFSLASIISSFIILYYTIKVINQIYFAYHAFVIYVAQGVLTTFTTYTVTF